MIGGTMHSPRFVLASASPRRAELLRAAGFDFEVLVGTTDETPLAGEPPASYVRRVAEAKAHTVGDRANGLPVLAADTVVVIDGLILGKPIDPSDARRMLALLSGRTHEVMTGVSLTDPRAGRGVASVVETTTVELAPLSPAEIAWYAASGEPDDKAGAYAIQGLASRFVRRIDGSYSNVVGLPIARVYEMLGTLGRED